MGEAERAEKRRHAACIGLSEGVRIRVLRDEGLVWRLHEVSPCSLEEQLSDENAVRIVGLAPWKPSSFSCEPCQHTPAYPAPAALSDRLVSPQGSDLGILALAEDLQERISAQEAADRFRSASDSLADIAAKVEAGGATRDDLDPVIAEIAGTQRRHFGRLQRARPGEGGKQKILAFLKEHLGEVVYGEELAAIAGIGEWARRVRELRVEGGYDIAELGNSSYRLESGDPDEERAARWRTLNRIRRIRGSASIRLRALFEAFVGEVVTTSDLIYVSKIASGPRRSRELRDEFGWPINTKVDEPELGVGEYRLVSTDPADRPDPRQRIYPDNLRERVFTRDHYTCQVCGRNREKALAAGDTRFFLEVHHKRAVAEELDALSPEELNKEENLITYCHRDHIRETAKLQERRRRDRRDRAANN